MPMTFAQQNTATLMQALHFNADELLLNRQGKLSTAQAERIGAQLRAGTQAGWLIALFVLLVFAIGFGALLLFGGLDLSLNEAPIILLGIGGSMLLWGVMVVVGLLRSRAQARKGTWPVYQVSGRVRVSIASEQMMTPAARAAMSVGGDGVAEGSIQIGKVYLAVWEEAANAFIPGNPYVIYYVGSKRGGLPVSAEAMEESSGSR